MVGYKNGVSFYIYQNLCCHFISLHLFKYLDNQNVDISGLALLFLN
uniref:Uncharacterized protein n=1 Tax=Rhizophora mucronata TaxID=61149 RepID=A0A2P2Q6Y1_RHIMU